MNQTKEVSRKSVKNRNNENRSNENIKENKPELKSIENKEENSGYPWQLLLLLAGMALAVVGLILKALSII